MSSDRGGIPRTPVDPVETAQHLMAGVLHDDLLRELGQDTAAIVPVGNTAPQQQYERMLFGQLAMHLAGVELPENATRADRARGIVNALQRITTTPSLFEAVTDAPYTAELATGIAPKPRNAVEIDQDELKLAKSIQKAVAKRGYLLEHAMVPENRSIQLVYKVSPGASPKQGMFRRKEMPDDGTVALTLMAYGNKTRSWDVRQYNRWDSVNGYTGYIGKDKAYLRSAFNLVAANASFDLPKIQDLVGDVVTIGPVGVGTQLKLVHDFRRAVEEVPGYEKDIDSRTLSLPLGLTQAYFGASRDFPLFPE